MFKTNQAKTVTNPDKVLLPSNKAFTLAEVMVVLFVMTIILAAFAPLMTVRAKSTSHTSPWNWASPDSANTYFGVNPNQRVMIGQKTGGTDPANKLTINSSSNQSTILFKENGSALAHLNILPGGFFFNKTGAPNFVSSSLSYGNTAFGSGALENITSAYENTAFGSGALSALTTGNLNVAVGASALRSSTGTANIGIGYWALARASGGENIAIGKNAGQGITTGTANVAIGTATLYSNATGVYNTMIGHRACQSLSSSTTRTSCLGAYAGPSAADTTANKIYLGNTGSTVYVLGYLNATNSNISSDKRLKKIESENQDGLEKIKQIKPVNFTFKDDKKKTPRVGVIAQDLKKVFPKAVMKGDDGFLKIRQEDMFYAMINAIKELANRDDAKDKKIEELEKRLENLERLKIGA